VFEPDAVARLFHAHLDGTVDAYHELCALVTVALWLRRYAVQDWSDTASAAA